MLFVRPGLVIPDHELSWRFSRSSGPGGQSVNTSDSRAELSFDVLRSPSLTERQRERALRRLATRLADGVLTIAASDQRSQLANRESARARLAAVLKDATAADPAPRRPTRPSRSAVEKRIAGKKRRAEVKRARQRPDD